MPERTVLIAVNHLQVRERRHAAWAPGNDSMAAIDEPFVVEMLEDGPDRARRTGVHGELKPAPIARRTEDPHLLAHAPAKLVHECPGALDELLATQIVACEPF